MFNITPKQYEKLSMLIKNIYPNQYEDILHDVILNSDNWEQAKKGWQTHKKKYQQSREEIIYLIDKYPSELQCKGCKKMKPKYNFSQIRGGNIMYVRNYCNSCRAERDLNKNKRVKEWKKRNPEKVKEYSKRQRQSEGYAEKQKEWQRKWREKNKLK